MRTSTLCGLGAVAVSAAMLAGCGAAGNPAATGTTPPPSPQPLALPTNPELTPSLAPGMGAAETTQSGVGPATIPTGIDAQTRQLFVVVTCSGPLPFSIKNLSGVTHLQIGSAHPKPGERCDIGGADGYQYKVSSADRFLRIVTSPTTRWTVGISVIAKYPVVQVS